MKEYIDRLMQKGIPLSCAKSMVASFLDDEDLEGLKGYINLIENGYTPMKMEGK